MNPQLAAFFNAHKAAVIGGGAAAVAGLALYQRKKSAGTAPAATAGATVPGTIPAAAVAGSTPVTGGGAYDSSAYDVYNALQPEFSNLEQQMQTGGTGSGVASAVSKPIASTLLAPAGTGHYVQNANGTIAEVESDGSLYGMQAGEFKPYYDAGARPQGYVPNSLQMYNLSGNLASRQAAGDHQVSAAG